MSCTVCNGQYIYSKIIIKKLPTILCISLEPGHKIQFFNPEIKVQDSEKSYVYNLFAIIKYTGGHYYANVKFSSVWYNTNDRTVTKTDIMENYKQAYMVFYEKAEPKKP